MAEVFVSPGVYTQEMDDTFSPPPGAAAIGAALVGYTKKGPAYLPTTVNSFGQFRDRFGGLNPEFYMPYAANSYLRNSSTLSVTRVFFISSATFGAMSIYGYTTKRDLTKLGSFLMMGLIGIIIASLVNIFMKSSMMYFVISVLGVLIFVGLTAYDTQKIKNMYTSSDTGELMGKKAVMGALTLYLDFINLFIMLLRLFGQRR